MNNWMAVLTPNASVTQRVRFIIVLGWLASVFVVWQFGHIPLLPSPGETFAEFGTLWVTGVFSELLTSIGTMLEALLFTVIITLSLAYLTVVPVVRPFSMAVAAMRFLGLTGLTLVYTMLTANGDALKVTVLTSGVTVFFLKDMIRVVQDIPRERHNHARTLGMGPWRVTWEVVVLGTFDQAFDSLRVSAAMGWMMLTMVEGLVLSGGGIGSVLFKMNRHFDLTAILAIQLMIFFIGIGQDALIGLFKRKVCPYAALDKVR